MKKSNLVFYPMLLNFYNSNSRYSSEISDFPMNSHLKIFLNPTQHSPKIKSQLAFGSVLIHDLTEREIIRVASTNSRINQQINMTKLESGIYYLTVQSGNLKTTQKFLKR